MYCFTFVLRDLGITHPIYLLTVFKIWLLFSVCAISIPPVFTVFQLCAYSSTCVHNHLFSHILLPLLTFLYLCRHILCCQFPIRADSFSTCGGSFLPALTVSYLNRQSSKDANNLLAMLTVFYMCRRSTTYAGIFLTFCLLSICIDSFQLFATIFIFR